MDTSEMKRPHYCKNTKNRSFLNMVSILQEHGIGNPFFILKTYDDELAEVTDYQKYLEDSQDNDDPTKEYIRRAKLIEEECKHNIWFFLREIVRIPVPDTKGAYDNSIRFELNTRNILAIAAYDLGASVCISGTTRSGKSLIVFLLAIHSVLKDNAGKARFMIGLEQSSIQSSLFSRFRQILETTSEVLPSLSGILSILMPNNYTECTSERALNTCMSMSNNQHTSPIVCINVHDSHAVEDIFSKYFEHMRGSKEKSRLYVDINTSNVIQGHPLLSAYIKGMPEFELSDINTIPYFQKLQDITSVNDVVHVNFSKI